MQNCDFFLAVLFGSGLYVPCSSPPHKEEATPEFCATSSSGNKFSDSSINITKLLYGHVYNMYAFIFDCTGSLLLSTGFLELQRVRGYSLSLVVVSHCGPLIAMASPIAEHGL